MLKIITFILLLCNILFGSEIDMKKLTQSFKIIKEKSSIPKVKKLASELEEKSENSSQKQIFVTGIVAKQRAPKPSKRKMKEIIETYSNKQEYSTEVFQCYSDYKKCNINNENSWKCLALSMICLGDALID